MDALPIALAATTATADPTANAAAVSASLSAAAAAGARLLLTPEAALIGYPGAERAGCADLDAAQLAKLETTLDRQAAALGIGLLVGSASPWQGGWSNDCFCCGAVPRQLRYRKRALTPLDQHHFRPGPLEQACVLDCDAWRCGLSICYELRFPTFWTAPLRAGVDALLSIAYMAGPDPDPGSKAELIPRLYAARAGECVTPLAVCNTAAADRWCDSRVIDARGRLQEQRGEGLLIGELRHREQLPGWSDWYAALYADAQRWAR